MPNKSNFKKGFTLIELSIVIVIIGLIVAGVVGGQSLVRQAKIRSVASDFTKYKTALNTFVLEYNALPGDMRTATRYWTGGVTADGDGDRNIEHGGTINDTESIRAWEHLSLAEIIPGSYTGDGTAGIGVNLPVSAIDGETTYTFNSHDAGMFGVIEGRLFTGVFTSANRPWELLLRQRKLNTLMISLTMEYRH